MSKMNHYRLSIVDDDVGVRRFYYFAQGRKNKQSTGPANAFLHQNCRKNAILMFLVKLQNQYYFI